MFRIGSKSFVNFSTQAKSKLFIFSSKIFEFSESHKQTAKSTKKSSSDISHFSIFLVNGCIFLKCFIKISEANSKFSQFISKTIFLFSIIIFIKF
nr:MAG TPA: hypothetical protein [Caudoviricetes sp.]